MTSFSQAHQEITKRGKRLFVVASLSVLMAVPALAGDKTRIEMHIGPRGATIESRDTDGWRERTDLRVNPYDGEVDQYKSQGYYGRNQHLRDGDAPDVVDAREDSWGRLVCPQGYFPDTTIGGDVKCFFDERAYRERDRERRPYRHHDNGGCPHPRSYREACEQR